MSVTRLSWAALRRKQPSRWTNQELAEFYRVSEILSRSGLNVETESGLSDEGDPWLAFARVDSGEVVAHFARIDGVFIAASAVTQEIYRGAELRNLINQMLGRHPMLVPPSSGDRVLLHPGVALTAFVAAAYVLASEEARTESIDEALVAAFAFTMEDRAQAISDDTRKPGLAAPDAEFVRIEEDGELSRMGAQAHSGGSGSEGDLFKSSGQALALVGAVIMAVELVSFDPAVTPADASAELGLLDETLAANGADARPTPKVNDGEVATRPAASETLQADAGLGTSESGSLGQPAEGAEQTSDGDDQGTDGPGQHDGILVASAGPLTVKVTMFEPATADVLAVVDEQLRSTDGFALDDTAGAGATVLVATGKPQPSDGPVSDGVSDDPSTSSTGLSDPLKDATVSLAMSGEDAEIALIDIVGLVNTSLTNKSETVIAFLDTGAGTSTELDVTDYVLSGMAVDDSGSSFSLDSVETLSVLDADASDDVQSTRQDVATVSPLDQNDQTPTASSVTGTSSTDTSPTVSGHWIDQSSPTSLTLTDTVDVLLYKGGNVEVSNFDLGKDRIWFFIDDDTAMTIDSYEAGSSRNVILEFEDGGTLTLLGVIDVGDTNPFV